MVSDTEAAKREAALRGEKRSTRFLKRAALASRADGQFRADAAAAGRTLDGLIEKDPGGFYPQVMRALHVPGRRTGLTNRYREVLGALAPHLPRAGPEIPVDHWEQLYEAFPERRGLIDFTHLMRSGHEEEVADRFGAVDRRYQRRKRRLSPQPDRGGPRKGRTHRPGGPGADRLAQ